MIKIFEIGVTIMIIVGKNKVFIRDPFELEEDLEKSIQDIQRNLFGESRVYLDIKKKIGDNQRKQNIPDGYLIDLSNSSTPKLFVVEVELGIHEPLRHIAVQLLEFSLSFESSKQKIKTIIKDALKENIEAYKVCLEFAQNYQYENIDYLLEKMIYKEKDAFNALVIIDEVDEVLEKVLREKFRFPIEIVVIERLQSISGETAYSFEPFLQEVSLSPNKDKKYVSTNINSDLIDTIVVPAQEEGFIETFLGENRWYAIRIHSSMIDKIKYIAAYQIAPISAITHIAEVQSIEPWNDTNKYVVNFKNPAKEIRRIGLVPKSSVKAPQAPRYTTWQKLIKAENLDQVF